MCLEFLLVARLPGTVWYVICIYTVYALYMYSYIAANYTTFICVQLSKSLRACIQMGHICEIGRERERNPGPGLSGVLVALNFALALFLSLWFCQARLSCFFSRMLLELHSRFERKGKGGRRVEARPIFHGGFRPEKNLAWRKKKKSSYHFFGCFIRIGQCICERGHQARPRRFCRIKKRVRAWGCGNGLLLESISYLYAPSAKELCIFYYFFGRRVDSFWAMIIIKQSPLVIIFTPLRTCLIEFDPALIL